MRIAFVSIPLGLALTAGFIATGLSVIWALLLAALLCSAVILLLGALSSFGRSNLRSASDQSWPIQQSQEREAGEREQASAERTIG
jgi:hypothetical protein